MKTCSKCKIEKHIYDFRKRSSATDGLQSECKACAKIHYEKNKAEYIKRAALWNKENPEKKSAAQAVYAMNSRAQISKRMREYYQENREKRLSISKEWAKRNKEKICAYHRNRKAKIKNSEGSHTASDIEAILKAQRGLCANCKIRLLRSGKNKFHIDHIMPLSLGGSNWPSNLQCLCPTCNMRKNAKDPLDWAREQGRLI